jgi:glycerophosphoryl diester phosphodiesterase
MLLGLFLGENASLIFSAFEVLSPIVFFSMILALTILLNYGLYSLVQIFHDFKDKTIKISSRKGITSIVVLVLCGAIYLSPFLFLPSNVLQGPLPTKPNLIGHRCARSLGPENTLEATQTALSFGIIGVEVDIKISIDGIPFLLHDDTLKRTTNVESLFPEKADEMASNFLISEIRQLDAGSWFIDSDPFGTIASSIISISQAENYQGAQIPTLAEIVELVKQENLILNTDFKYPPSNHPFYENYLNTCLSVIEEVQIDDLIWITSYDKETLYEIKSKYPNMNSVLSVEIGSAPSAQDFIEMDFDLINTHHGIANDLFRQYNKEGILVNTWTVNSISRFSQLWCLGVDYVTTDTPQDFQNLDTPIWSLSSPIYVSIWIILDVVCIILIGYRFRQSISSD